jgi:hypothetical protein
MSVSFIGIYDANFKATSFHISLGREAGSHAPAPKSTKCKAPTVHFCRQPLSIIAASLLKAFLTFNSLIEGDISPSDHLILGLLSS